MLVEIKIVNKEEVTVVTSLDVAETFGKEHKNVLADIRNIQSDISSAEFSALFYEGTYTASNGKKNPMYYITEMALHFWSWDTQAKKLCSLNWLILSSLMQWKKLLSVKSKSGRKESLSDRL